MMKVETMVQLIRSALIGVLLMLSIYGTTYLFLQKLEIHEKSMQNSHRNYYLHEMSYDKQAEKDLRELREKADEIFLTRETSYQPNTKMPNSSISTNTILSNSYVVDTPFCKIPNFNPIHSKIRKYVRSLKPAVCKRNTSVVYQSGLYLYVNHTAARLPPYKNSLKFCTYRPIYRPKLLPTHKDFMWYMKESEPFNLSTKVQHEFVRVNCYNKENNSIYINFHAFVQPNTDLYAMFKHRLRVHMKESKLKQHLNVMLVGIDSVSRLSFRRQMVKTRAFLKHKLAAFDMMGYNKVADNTFVNMLPLMLGKYLEEIPWNRSRTFDKFDFIWKQYSKRGYRTFFAEDRPDMSTFDYIKKGFDIPPGEHYYRPLSIAMSKEKDFWYRHHTCFKDRLEAEIILNYNYDFVDTFRNNSHFSFTFLSGLTHDYPNGTSAVDDLFFRFFKRLYVNDLISNTVIFFFSDHGMRYGAVRETFIGKLEERLPFMYIIVPTWFGELHSKISNMLNTNQNKLSTPFDVYETLQDILFFDGSIKPANVSSRGVSWFREIPYTRSCETAGILSHWCTCLLHQKLPTDSAVVVSASFKVLNVIKKILFRYDSICEELSISRIKEATRIYESDEILLGAKGKKKIENDQVTLESKRKESTEDVQVLFETIPGNALFEATVRVMLSKTRSKYRLVGDISRINVYGNQSACIEDFYLKKFCFCK